MAYCVVIAGKSKLLWWMHLDWEKGSEASERNEKKRRVVKKIQSKEEFVESLPALSRPLLAHSSSICGFLSRPEWDGFHLRPAVWPCQLSVTLMGRFFTFFPDQLTGLNPARPDPLLRSIRSLRNARAFSLSFPSVEALHDAMAQGSSHGSWLNFANFCAATFLVLCLHLTC